MNNAEAAGKIVTPQFHRLIGMVGDAQWVLATELLQSIRQDRPFFARLIAQYNDRDFGLLAQHCLSDSRCVQFLRELLVSGFDPNQVSAGGNHILLDCMRAYSGFVDSNSVVFETLLQGGANPNAIGDPASGRPLLQVAIRDKPEPFAALLLKYGADPRISAAGDNAFSIAGRGCFETGRELLANWVEQEFEWS